MGLTMLCSCYCNELLTVTKVPCSLHVSLIDLSIFFFPEQNVLYSDLAKRHFQWHDQENNMCVS